jgi:hypothetical protein
LHPPWGQSFCFAAGLPPGVPRRRGLPVKPVSLLLDDPLPDVLTNDRHFEQEGFRAIFRS